MAEHDAANQEHLGQITKVQLVAQTPKHRECDNVTRALGPVQQAAAALVELLAARAAAEPPVSARSVTLADPQPKHRILTCPSQNARHPTAPAAVQNNTSWRER